MLWSGSWRPRLLSYTANAASVNGGEYFILNMREVITQVSRKEYKVMDISNAYEQAISRERIERIERERQYEEDQVEHERIKPAFPSYCKRIAKFRAARLLDKVYVARVANGLPPFTHSYDYPLRDNCWLAKKDFDCKGRYGTDSGDFVFVPKGVSVKGCDDTIVIYIDEWNRNSFVPAYSNTV